MKSSDSPTRKVAGGNHEDPKPLARRTRPKISIITVTLNDLAGLMTMTASLELQDYPEVEHVIVDGASSDGTILWLEKYSPSYTVSWVSENDAGIFDAMNKGAGMAKGDLIVFMNSGDSFSGPSALSELATQWQSGSWHWAYGQMQYVNESGSNRGFTSQYPHWQRGLELGVRFAPHQATYIERELFERLGGFDLAFEYACDQEFALRAGKLTPPRVVESVLAKFLEGGVHSQTTYWRRERIYHRMRVKNDVLLLNSKLIDRGYTETMALYREVRQGLGHLKRWFFARAPFVRSVET